MKARHTANFVPNWRAHCRPIDRNARARIVMLAEALERRTKGPGRRNGQLGYIGVLVLRSLLFTFMNNTTGLLCPSYAALERKTGLCRQSVGRALARLERAGILRILRRLCRQWVERINPVTGEPERYMATTQATSLYSVHEPGAWADHLVMPRGKNAPFPSPKQMSLLERSRLTWKSTLQLSLPGREKPHSPSTPSLSDLLHVGGKRGFQGS